jgi:hypothetical protein
MMADQAVADFHDLDEVHLVTIGCLSRILPNEHSTTIG